MKSSKSLIIILTFCLISCNKNDTERTNYFLSANIDNVERTFEGYAQLDFNHQQNYFFTTIHSFNKEFEDGKLRDIYIYIHDPPKIGTYMFNNVSALIYDAGAMFRIWNVSSDLIYYSIDGYVNISKFTKTTVTGTFEFRAVSFNGTDSVVIKNGEFYSLISAVSEGVWNGIN